MSEFLYSMWGSKNLKDAANPTGDKERLEIDQLIRNRSVVGVTIDGVLAQITKRSRDYFLSCQDCLSFSFHFQFFFLYLRWEKTRGVIQDVTYLR